MSIEPTRQRNPQIVRYTLIASVISLVLNLALYLYGRGEGWIPDDMPASTETFSVTSVILASVLPVIAFGALMAWLAAREPRVSWLFTMILMVVLILAIAVPFVIQDIEMSFRWVLVAMHVVTAAAILMLTRSTAR